MSIEDIRWQQRFENFQNAFRSLKKGVQIAKERKLNELEEQGLIQAFEFTFELAWKTIKDYLEYNQVDVKFPRDVIKRGFQYEIIDKGDTWMDMLQKRNLMAHTYDEKLAKIAIELITTNYYAQLKLLYEWFKDKTHEE